MLAADIKDKNILKVCQWYEEVQAWRITGVGKPSEGPHEETELRWSAPFQNKSYTIVLGAGCKAFSSMF